MSDWKNPKSFGFFDWIGLSILIRGLRIETLEIWLTIKSNLNNPKRDYSESIRTILKKDDSKWTKGGTSTYCMGKCMPCKRNVMLLDSNMYNTGLLRCEYSGLDWGFDLIAILWKNLDLIGIWIWNNYDWIWKIDLDWILDF